MSKHDEVFTRGGLPAICVKIYACVFSKQVLDEFERDNNVSYMAAFRSWVDSAPDHARDSAWECACEAGWECIKEVARSTFGDRAQVYAEGRSGGWCVVHGLDNIEDWDDTMHASWAEFCEDVEQIVRNVPHDVVWHLYFDHFEPATHLAYTSARGMCE